MSVLLVLAVVLAQSPEATRIDDPEAFGPHWTDTGQSYRTTKGLKGSHLVQLQHWLGQRGKGPNETTISLRGRGLYTIYAPQPLRPWNRWWEELGIKWGLWHYILYEFQNSPTIRRLNTLYGMNHPQGVATHHWGLHGFRGGIPEAKVYGLLFTRDLYLRALAEREAFWAERARPRRQGQGGGPAGFNRRTPAARGNWWVRDREEKL